ncbi:MAG: hypothetical protein JO005_07960, partial [Gammaproteobacteria bacterium]|nr:hypothetical protein [Gammaproteobacteria bacterium]
SVADSYAGRTGRPQNVGIVGVALFRERPVPSYAPAPGARREAEQGGMPAAAAADSSLLNGARAQSRAAPASAPLAAQLGTGHGTREYSYVQQTTFQRQQERPNEVVRIRYDSMENLIALGIMPRPRPAPVRPDAFPGSSPSQYVPDPPG